MGQAKYSTCEHNVGDRTDWVAAQDEQAGRRLRAANGEGPRWFLPLTKLAPPDMFPCAAQPETCRVLVQEEEVSKQLAVGLAAGEVRALLQKWPEASRQVILCWAQRRVSHKSVRRSHLRKWRWGTKRRQSSSSLTTLA